MWENFLTTEAAPSVFLSCCSDLYIVLSTGGDPLGQFAIGHIQNEWKVSVRKPLDREVRDNYLLNITASDGIFTAKSVVEVKVLDANDNDPVCEKVTSRLLFQYVVSIFCAYFFLLFPEIGPSLTFSCCTMCPPVLLQ